ncbi:MAG: DUF3105 domain-containing protein [Frankiaceae bacterium]|nr:DUF3105 domain-containing protein [Frankiaceae bacterium]
MRRTAAPTAALAVIALLLTACGGGEEAEPSAPAASGEASAPAVDDPVVVEPPDIEGLEVLAEDPSHEHVEGPLEYDRVPPLGGEHNPRWLACDVYDEPVPHEFAVHSIEHGAVWLAHAPDLPAEQVELLADLAATDREYVLVSPERGLDSRVVAVTWGAALEASSAGDRRLAEFVEAYAGGDQGGEPGVPCRGQGVTPREAGGML